MAQTRFLLLLLTSTALASCLDWSVVEPSVDADADGDSDAHGDADQDDASAADGDADSDFHNDSDVTTDGDLDSDADTDGDQDLDGEVEADSDADGVGDGDVGGDADDIDPCTGVSCSDHGRCISDGTDATCLCDDGYRVEGLECICVPDCGERECGLDPACETESCGTCTSIDTRCDEDTGMCVVPSCDGGLLDVTTGLCWQDPPTEVGTTFYDAGPYCTGLSRGEYGPGSWHLPTIGELRSLLRGCPQTVTGGACAVADDCTSHSCMAGCSGCSRLGGPGAGGAYWLSGLRGGVGYYWSSSMASGVPGAGHWLVCFDTGALAHVAETSSHYVRCVRPGP